MVACYTATYEDFTVVLLLIVMICRFKVDVCIWMNVMIAYNGQAKPVMNKEVQATKSLAAPTLVDTNRLIYCTHYLTKQV